jgi:hypothetical protein
MANIFRPRENWQKIKIYIYLKTEENLPNMFLIIIIKWIKKGEKTRKNCHIA